MIHAAVNSWLEFSRSLSGQSLSPLLAGAATVTSVSVSSPTIVGGVSRISTAGGAASSTSDTMHRLDAEEEAMRKKLEAKKRTDAEKAGKSETITRMQRELEELELKERMDAATRTAVKKDLEKKMKDTKKRKDEIRGEIVVFILYLIVAPLNLCPFFF